MRAILNLIRARQMRRDLTDEIHSHIEERIDDLIESGVPRDEARSRALREFGNPAQYGENGWDVWGWVSLERLVRDARIGLLQMRRNPGFTAAAIVSMALGIAANAVIFSLVHTVLLRALPYPHPERLVMVSAVPPAHPEFTSQSAVPDFVAWRDRNLVFDFVAAVNDVDRDLGADANGALAARIYGQLTTPALFEIVGVKPLIGRVYTEEEDRIDRDAAVVVISHRLWTSRYNRDPKVLGARIRLDGEPTTVIGVMPPGFNFFNSEADFWRPLPMRTVQLQGAGRYIDTIARLKPGITLQQAQAQLESVARQLEQSLPAHNKGWGVRVRVLREAELGDFSRPMIMLESLAGIVLLIACANVAGLLLARAGPRAKEVAIRAALGAGRLRIVRQLLTESVLLSLLGGACGLALAVWGVRLLVAISPPWFPLLSDVAIDRTVLGFAVAVSIATGMVFGAAPAWQASRTNLAAAMKDIVSSAPVPGGRQRSRNLLVGMQIALSLTLLVCAGIAIDSFRRMESIDLGFTPEGLVGFQFRLPRTPYTKAAGQWNGFPLQAVSPEVESMFTRVRDRLLQVPGVFSAAGVSTPPLQGAPHMTFGMEGSLPKSTDSHSEPPSAAWFFVTPGYFETMRVPILNGRDFDERDVGAANWGVVINEAMAKLYWPNENPIGKRIVIEQGKDDPAREIIGVVRNMHVYRIEARPVPAMYVLQSQQSPFVRGFYSPLRREITFVLRVRGDGRNIVGAVRRAVSQIAPDEALIGMRPLDEFGAQSLQWPRYYAILLGIFAGIATTLAAVGIYGLVAYTVERRTREIGIRVAVGATRRRIALLVMRQALCLLSAGLAAGLAISLALTRLLASLLWGVTVEDPRILVLVSLMLAAVTLAASWAPARRALRVDPTLSLRYE
jgi:putative ABC transport system permease protein